MKKTIIAVLSVVLVLSLSMVALVACNNDEDEKTASNTEVLGTAVAVAAQSVSKGASVSSVEAGQGDDFKAGVNLTFGNDNFGFDLSADVNGVGEMVQPIIEKTVKKVDKLLGENGINVERGDSDKEGYTDKLTISGTYIDKTTGEEISYTYALYVGVKGGDGIDGKTDYTFNALLVIPNSDPEGEPYTYEFGGTASYSEQEDAMIFELGDGASVKYANAFAGIKAYSTKEGTVVVQLNAGAGLTAELPVKATANVTVEFGKIDDNGYGAIVTISGDATYATYGASFNVTVNVYANSKEDANTFDITGKFESAITVPDVPIFENIGGTYKASADLNGKAKYDVENDKVSVGVSGNVVVSKVEENK